MTDLSILEQCLLTCDAPESVWRPALEGMTSQIDDLKTAGRNALERVADHIESYIEPESDK